MTPSDKLLSEVREAQRDEDEAKRALIEYYNEKQNCSRASTMTKSMDDPDHSKSCRAIKKTVRDSLVLELREVC